METIPLPHVSTGKELLVNGHATIRSLKLLDIPALVAIEEACFARPWNAREFDLCMRQNHFHALGVCLQHTILAYVTFFFVVDEMEIVNLAVLNAWRRKGLGDHLLQELVLFAHTHDVCRIFLEVRRSNAAARELYTKNGFSVVGVRKKYYPPNGEDALIMECSAALQANQTT